MHVVAVGSDIWGAAMWSDIILDFPVIVVLAAMLWPRSRKINREKVLTSLNKAGPKCGFTITPDLVKRVDFERIECPECGEKFSSISIRPHEAMR